MQVCVCVRVRARARVRACVMSKHGFVKISYSISPWAWVLVVGSGHNSHIVKMSYFLKNVFVHATIKNRILIVYMYLMMSINTALRKLLNQFHDPKAWPY